MGRNRKRRVPIERLRSPKIDIRDGSDCSDRSDSNEQIGQNIRDLIPIILLGHEFLYENSCGDFEADAFIRASPLASWM